MPSPFRVHVERTTPTEAVFHIDQERYEAALARRPELAGRVVTTWGQDGDIFDEAMATSDALLGYAFPRDRLLGRHIGLRFIQILGAGIDYLQPFDWLPPGVALLTNSGAHAPKARESALMAVLMLQARLPELIRNQQRHIWKPIFTRRLQGQIALVVGVGRLGGAVAEALQVNGLRVTGIRRSGQPHPAVAKMYDLTQLSAAVAEADFVILTLPLTAETANLLDATLFARMKSGAGFINMARGGLVDSNALEAALRSGHLRGAVIDVTLPEPLPPENSLWDAPNLLITPHVISDDSDEFIPRSLDIFFDNVLRSLEGRPLLNQAQPQRGY